MTDQKTATLTLDGQTYQLPVTVGTEGEVGLDISKLRAQSKAITTDPGYGNTGSCFSAITFIDGANGILRYRGYPIEQLAEKTTFDEVIHLLIFGHLPSKEELQTLRDKINKHSLIDDKMIKIIESFPKNTHPMAILSAATIALSSFRTWGESNDEDTIYLLAQFKGIVAYIHRYLAGKPYVNSRQKGSYVEDYLWMMFEKEDEVLVSAFNKLFVLHADHEQNCSASTVRMVGSSQCNLPGSISAGIAALWGPLHGGANQAVIEQLVAIQEDGGDVEKFVNMAKDKTSDFRLMGFGHRVYKNFDPRAKIIKVAADNILEELDIHDASLDIAKKLEKAALEDQYFVDRSLYPNVDFYSGIIYRALGIPTPLFTVMFALGRLPGWIAQWREWVEDPKSRIQRPRQIYTGPTKRDV